MLLVHTYDTPGTYTVTLSVEGSGTCDGEDVTTAEVEVIAPPEIEALFDVTQTALCEQMLVELMNSSVGDDVLYQWDFGDGETSNASDPTHQYDSPGSYTITLTISEDVCDLTSTYEDVIVVNNGASYELGPDELMCWSDDFITLDAGTQSGITDYNWSTGDESQTVNVSEPGEYIVEVTIDNCQITDGLVVSLVEEMFLLDEITVCEGLEARLEVPPYSGSPGFEWCTGETNFYVTVSEAQEVCYDFIDEFGCPQSGSFQVNFDSNKPNLFIPNAFTSRSRRC